MTENVRVSQIRKDHNLTLEEFGNRLGVSRSAISNIECGKRGVTNQMRAAIIKEFNVNETWFRTGDESGGKYLQKTVEDEIADLFTEIMNAPEDDNLRCLARAFARLSPQQRRDAADLAKALAESYQE
ncbi:MAG: helix-turn-helix domain-containing protein [Clostridiales bacterium]|nr:helix-turn-helix domain-containing protein [Clostridiales bacterium]